MGLLNTTITVLRMAMWLVAICKSSNVIMIFYQFVQLAIIQSVLEFLNAQMLNLNYPENNLFLKYVLKHYRIK